MSEAKSSLFNKNIMVLTLCIPFCEINQYEFFRIPKEGKELEESEEVVEELGPYHGSLVLKGSILEDVSKAVNNFKEHKPSGSLFNFAIVIDPTRKGSSKFMFWDGENVEVHDPSSFTYSVDPHNDSVTKYVSKENFNVLALSKEDSFRISEIEKLFAMTNKIKSYNESTRAALPTEKELAAKVPKNVPLKRFVFALYPKATSDMVPKEGLRKTLEDFVKYHPKVEMELKIPASRELCLHVLDTDFKDNEYNTSLYNLLNTMSIRANSFGVVVAELNQNDEVLNTWHAPFVNNFSVENVCRNYTNLGKPTTLINLTGLFEINKARGSDIMSLALDPVSLSQGKTGFVYVDAPESLQSQV